MAINVAFVTAAKERNLGSNVLCPTPEAKDDVMLKNILKTLFMGWIAKKFAGRSARNSDAYRR